MNDEYQLIRRILDGQSDCFRVLVERYERPVFCFVRNLVPDSHECEDLAQDTFMAAYKNLGSYDPRRSAFSTWLLTIARNKCLNRLKKRKPLVLEAIPEEALSREADVRQREMHQSFDDVLESLPLEQRTAFVLSEIQGLTYEEVSKIELVKMGTVKSRISPSENQAALPDETSVGASMMSQEDLYELWKQSRANASVPDGFSDRVLGVIHETESLGRQRFVGRLLLAILASRPGRITVCVSAGALFIVRIGHVLALFVTT